MAKYKIYTKIESNVPASSLFYDLSVYRTDSEKKKHVLLSVSQQPLDAAYHTEVHETNETDDDLSVIYLMEMMLYRQHGGKMFPALSAPSTKMYTLGEMSSGKAYSKNKRENVCYFETKAQAKPVNENGDNNVHHVKITCLERAFIAKAYPVGDPNDPFEKSKIDQQINERVNYLTYPYQGGASVCGSAAFFYCLQKDRPDIYAQAVRELWLYGKTRIGELEIAPGDGCRHPAGAFYTDEGEEKISGADWMTLAGLRDTENTVLSFDTLDSPVAGVTLWQTVTEWFEKAGYEKVFSNVGITEAGVQGVNDLNEYVNKGYHVVTLICDSLLEDSSSWEKLTVPTHWIAWESLVTLDDNGYVHLDLFSWGNVSDQIKSGKSLSFFIKRFYGGMVFKPLK